MLVTQENRTEGFTSLFDAETTLGGVQVEDAEFEKHISIRMTIAPHPHGQKSGLSFI